MKSKNIYIPNSFPDTFLQYSSKEIVDESGIKQVVPVVTSVNVSDIDILPLEAYPSLEAQLSAGVLPKFVNPVISSRFFESDNSDIINSSLESISEITNNSSNSTDNSNNSSVNY